MGHPFASLFVTYELAVSRFDPVDRAAAALRLRNAYRDAWTDKASLVNNARKLTPFHRSKTDPPSRGHRPHWVVIRRTASPPPTTAVPRSRRVRFAQVPSSPGTLPRSRPFSR